MKKILNLTQHKATSEQIKAGVVDIDDKFSDKVKDLLTFDSIPSKEDMIHRAESLAAIALRLGYEKVMIGGAPYFMSTLESVLRACNIDAAYAFSKRITEEKVLEDGSIEKKTVFKHEGFININ